MREVILGFVGVVLGAILSLTGQLILSSKEHDAKLIEIAVGVLRAEPKPEIAGARKWAIRIINSTSVPLTKDEEQSLLKYPIPFVLDLGPDWKLIPSEEAKRLPK